MSQQKQNDKWDFHVTSQATSFQRSLYGKVTLQHAAAQRLKKDIEAKKDGTYVPKKRKSRSKQSSSKRMKLDNSDDSDSSDEEGVDV